MPLRDGNSSAQRCTACSRVFLQAAGLVDEPFSLQPRHVSFDVHRQRGLGRGPICCGEDSTNHADTRFVVRIIPGVEIGMGGNDINNAKAITATNDITSEDGWFRSQNDTGWVSEKWAEASISPMLTGSGS